MAPPNRLLEAPVTPLLEAQTEQKEQQAWVKPVSPDSKFDYTFRRDSDPGVSPNHIYPVVSRLSQCLQFRGFYA
jgi:hypothetical protein